MKSPFQTLGFASCSSALAGNGTPRSGHSAETLTAQPRGSRGGVFMHRKTLTLIKPALCGLTKYILI